MNFEGTLLVRTLLSRGMTELIPVVKCKVDIPLKDHLVVSFHRSTSFGSCSGLKSQVIETFGPKFASCEKNDPLTGKFSKFFSERIHHLTDLILVCKFCEIWPSGNW